MRHIVSGPVCLFSEGPMPLGWWLQLFLGRAIWDRAAYKEGEQLCLIAS